MVPRTFPSTLDSVTGVRSMVVYFLTSVAGLQRWVDYIPVSWSTAANQKHSSYDANGYISVDSSAVITGKQAWVDYVPVYLDPNASGAWNVTLTGFVPIGGNNVVAQLFSSGEPGAVFMAQKPSEALARRNKTTYSEDFTNAVWGKNSLTTGVTTTASNGVTMTRLVEVAATATHNITSAPISWQPGKPCYVSYFVQAAERTFVAVYEGTIGKGKFFNLSAGTVGGNLVSPPDGASIYDLGGGLYRCEILVTPTSAIITPALYLSTDGSTFSYAGNTANGLLAGGAMAAETANATYQKVTDWTTEFLAQAGSLCTQWDATGATPVTALEQQVGLHLDVKPIFLGPELVTNGRFASDISGWTQQGSGDITASWVSGTMQLVRGAGGILGAEGQSISTRAGVTYLVSVLAGGNAAGVASCFGTTAGSGDLLGPGAQAAAGTGTRQFTATGGTSYITFWPFSANTTVTLDNISVREVISVPNTVGQVLRSAEQITNGDFSSSTGWTLSSSTISGGTLNIGSAAGGVSLATNNTIPVGVWCEVVYTIVSITGTISAGPNISNPGTQRTTAGTYREIIFTTTSGAAGVFARGAGVTSAVVDNLSVKIIYGSHRSQSSGAAQAKVSARYNKVTARNANPVDLTNVTFTNAPNALATLTVVNDAAALAAAGLSSICTLGNVYKLDNTSGNGIAFADVAGNTGNTNAHALRVVARGSGTGLLTLNTVGTGPALTLNPAYSVTSTASLVGSGSSDHLQVRANAGAVVYFILPDLREACYSYLPTPQVVWDSTTGYDDTGFPARLVYSGAQGYQTGSVDFSGSDKAQLWAGWSKLSDAAFASTIELSNSLDTNNGTFYYAMPGGASQNILMAGKGTTVNSASVTPGVAPQTFVATGLFDLGAPLQSARINGGTAVGSNAGASGGGVFGSYPINYGSRDAASTRSLATTGDEFISIVRGGSMTSTDPRIVSVEQYCRQKMLLSF